MYTAKSERINECEHGRNILNNKHLKLGRQMLGL